MNTRRALAFIFCTVTLDCLALGIMLPVLPTIVLGFMDGDTAGAAEMFGVFATTWGLDAVPLLAAARRAVRSLRPPARHPDLLPGHGARLHLHGDRAVAHAAAGGPHHLRHHRGHHRHLLRLHRRRHQARGARQVVRHRRHGLRPRLRAGPGDRRPAGRLRSAPAVLGVGRGLPDQRRVRLVRAARIPAAGAPHGVRLEARQSRSAR